MPLDMASGEPVGNVVDIMGGNLSEPVEELEIVLDGFAPLESLGPQAQLVVEALKGTLDKLGPRDSGRLL